MTLRVKMSYDDGGVSSIRAMEANAPLLMAVWSRALTLTASCLSPLSGFEYRPGHVRKLPVILCKAEFFAWYDSFLPHLQLT